MESGKKQNVIIILLVLIIILLLFLIGFLFIGNNKFNYNKIDDVVNNQNSIEEDINDNEVIYSDWMQHILDSDIQSITLTRNYNINSESSNTSDVNLTKENLENIFIKLIDYNLINYNTTGIGIPENQLVISYKFNEKNYNLIFYDGSINVDNGDEQLMTLLNNSNYTDNTGSNPGGIMFKFDDSYDGSIYDIYFEN